MANQDKNFPTREEMERHNMLDMAEGERAFEEYAESIMGQHFLSEEDCLEDDFYGASWKITKQGVR